MGRVSLYTSALGKIDGQSGGKKTVNLQRKVMCVSDESDGMACFMGKLKGLLKEERDEPLLLCVCVCVCSFSPQYQSLLLDFRALHPASPLLAMP